MPKTVKPSVKTPLFRGSYVALVKPRKVSEDSDRETFQILVPLKKSDPATKVFLPQLVKIMRAASAEKHGVAGGLELNKLKHCPIKDGDENDNPDFAGHWLIRASANYRPHAVDLNGNELETEEELYSGAWYKVKLSAWAWSNPKGGKGVSLNLESVLKIKDDQRFGGGSKATDDFADEISTGGGKEDPGASEADDLGL